MTKKHEFILCFEDGTWEEKIYDVPADVPETQEDCTKWWWDNEPSETRVVYVAVGCFDMDKEGEGL